MQKDRIRWSISAGISVKASYVVPHRLAMSAHRPASEIRRQPSRPGNRHTTAQQTRGNSRVEKIETASLSIPRIPEGVIAQPSAPQFSSSQLVI
jgi:hypothetical protein